MNETRKNKCVRIFDFGFEVVLMAISASAKNTVMRGKQEVGDAVRLHTHLGAGRLGVCSRRRLLRGKENSRAAKEKVTLMFK